MAHESLSALLDGECSAEELERLLDEMDRDPALKTAWSRMCQAREAQEGTRIGKEQPCICSDVMARLDALVVAGSPKVVPMTAPPPVRKRFDWKPWSGWAVAASVAMVAVALNVGGDKTGLPGEAGPGLMPQVTSPVSMPLPTARPRNLQTVSLDPDQQAAEDDLRGYLIEHSNALADRGMGGTLSYARFAAHTADLRVQPAVYTADGAQP